MLSFSFESVQPPSNFDLPKARISSFESVPQNIHTLLFLLTNLLFKS